MKTDDFSLYFQRVPYLNIEKAGAQRVEFFFRGAAGRAHRCAFGIVLGLAFPRGSAYRHEAVEEPMSAQTRHAHRLSLLLASSTFALDLGVQHDGGFWWLWKRFELDAIQTPDTVFGALDDMVALMRFLYYRCFKTLHLKSHRSTLQAAQFA